MEFNVIEEKKLGNGEIIKYVKKFEEGSLEKEGFEKKPPGERSNLKRNKVDITRLPIISERRDRIKVYTKDFDYIKPTPIIY